MNLRKGPPPDDPVFGPLHPLKQSLPTQLPSLGDIGKAIGYELHQLKVSFKQGVGDHVWDHSAAHDKVISDLHDVYDLASVGYIPDDRIREKIVNVWSMRREKMKGRYNGSRSKKGRGRKKRKIEEVMNDLFDVIDDKKTDKVEIDFVLDQRTSRKMWICLVTY